MFNFIAASWVIYWAGSKWGEAASAGSVKSESVPEQTILESIPIGDYLIPIGFVFAVVFGAVVWLFLRGSIFGYEMSIIGSSPKAATYAGMPTKRIMVDRLRPRRGRGWPGRGHRDAHQRPALRAGALQQHRLHRAWWWRCSQAATGRNCWRWRSCSPMIAIAGNVLTITGAPSELVFAMYGLTLLCAAIGQGLRHVRIVNPGPRRDRRRRRAERRGGAE